jgi:hypothetical protein
MNQEAIDYYRRRSRAPGVAEGGGARNHYCMECDGVIPLPPPGSEAPGSEAPAVCPHCGAALGERARRFFNWVEIDRPARSDARAIAPLALAGACAAAALATLVWWILCR